MKIFKRIAAWAALSLALQFSGLFYINNYFLSENTNIKISKMTNKNTEKAYSKVELPSGAKNISTSYNGKYIAYCDNSGLKVVNTYTGDKKTVETDKGAKVSCYKWLSDRNRMLIAEKQPSSNTNGFKLSYYDVDRNVKDKITDLPSVGSKSEVAAIEASPLTNMIYVEISQGNNRNSIYSINIMKETRKTTLHTSTIGKICIAPHEDNLFYEDYVYKKVYSTKTGRAVEIAGVDKCALLSTDENDNVYVGKLSDGSVTKIYYGNISAGSASFNEINLENPFESNDILIASDGKIYLNDNLRGQITELASGKAYTYPGNFIQIYEGGILSLSEGKAVETAME